MVLSYQLGDNIYYREKYTKRRQRHHCDLGEMVRLRERTYQYQNEVFPELDIQGTFTFTRKWPSNCFKRA